MTSSSRSKSHKKSKHSSREYSDVDEDVKMKEMNASNDDKENGVSIKVSKDSLVSGGKRKLGTDLSGVHGNGNLPEEYATPTKRQKEKTNGEEEKVEVANLDDKKSKSKEFLKVVGELKSNSSRKHDVYSANVDESKSGSQSKDDKEPKDKDRGSERERKNNEWPVEGVRNTELEKELEKRMRRRGEGYKNKDRYHDDVKEGNERLLSTKTSRVKDIKHKYEGNGDKYRETRHMEDKSRENGERVSKSRKDDKYHEDSRKDDKYHVDSDRDDKQRDKKYKESGGRVERNGDNKYREKRTSDPKHRDVDCDQVGRHRDNKDRSRDNDKDEGTFYRTCKVKDQNCESAKRCMSDDKVEQISVSHDHHRSSPNGKYYPTRDHHRVSKQEETKSRDYNGNSNKDFTSANGQAFEVSLQSSEKITQKDDNCINDSLSVSSPYMRNNHFSSNNKSFFLPQTPLRTQNNWNNIPNWPSSLPNNNYIPFPPIFNPIMHQFAPPIFHQPPIYHESIPPLSHNWGANNSIFGNGSHGYGRVDLENSKTQSNNQVWEDTGVTVDMRSPVKKEEFLSEETDIQVENLKNIPEAMKVKKEDDSLISRVYLSKIDISQDLTESCLYDQCTNMLDLDQASDSDEFDCKILFLEEGIEADVSNGGSLFAAISSCVFKKSMSFYTKQRGRNQEKDCKDGDADAGVEDSGSDEQLSTSEKMELELDAGGKDSGHKEAVDGGSLLIEFESVNLSRIH